MSLHKINRIRIIRYLHNIGNEGMGKYTEVYDWYRDSANYYGIMYRVTTENYGIIIFSPVNRSYIFQEGGEFWV